MRYTKLVALATLSCGLLGADNNPSWKIPQREGPHLVAMAACKTTGCINMAYRMIMGPEVVARVIYYTNLLRLCPRDKAAACGLLANIPATGDEYVRLTTLDGFLYDDETTEQINALGQAYWHMSRNLAHALNMCPRYLPEFIKYGRLVIGNHHDDYPNWAARVCRSNPNRFLRAFESLSLEDRRYVAKYIIRPGGCEQIAFPEAN